MTRVKEDYKDKKVKTLIDFNAQQTKSIKSIAVKKEKNEKVTTRFGEMGKQDGKMLRFSKISLKSFVYDMVDAFCFPNNKSQKIYKKNEIIKCFLRLNLTDTDSCSFFFRFSLQRYLFSKRILCEELNIFEIFRHSKIAERLDFSHEIWLNYDFHKPELEAGWIVRNRIN